MLQRHISRKQLQQAIKALLLQRLESATQRSTTLQQQEVLLEEEIQHKQQLHRDLLRELDCIHGATQELQSVLQQMERTTAQQE